jgi:WD40 repeat protein
LLAVTAVDWKKTNVLKGEILASCSDDRFIYIYDPNNSFVVWKALNTENIMEWHTLTYMLIENDHIFVSCENGYLVVYDLKKLDKSIWQKRIENGSIEGMVCRNNKLCVCSSDCTINILSLNFKV